MRVALFDPWSGVSGNMVLGALIDAGLPLDALKAELGRLPLRGWDLRAGRVLRHGFSGTLAEVSAPVEAAHRNLDDIRDIIRDAGLATAAEAGAVEAFERLASAEARAHGCSAGEVHFHETGAVDAMIDIVGAFAGLDLLGVGASFSTPVATGWGTARCAHGEVPVPAPATALLLEGARVRRGGPGVELTTPTGAAILATAVRDWSAEPPVMVLERSGMGAGSMDLEESPNLLRVMLGETADPAHGTDTCCEIVCLVDDMDPRLWPPLQAALLGSGAFDCYMLSGTGRKGRPAQELTVLCPAGAEEKVLEALFEGSTTLGARVARTSRAVLQRELSSVGTPWGPVQVKLGSYSGRVVTAVPELSDCEAVAGKSGVPVRRVLEAARASAESLVWKKGG